VYLSQLQLKSETPNANVECLKTSPSLSFAMLHAFSPLVSVDVFGSQVASLGLDEGMPLGEERDSYVVGQSRDSSDEQMSSTYPT